MNVFVTGGAGFIGHHVVNNLLADGHSVTVFDNVATGSRGLVAADALFIEEDIRNLEPLTEAMKDHDAVIHLAAQALVPFSIKHPQITWDINHTGGKNVLKAMQANGITKLVFSSTAAVYGVPEKQPIAEEDPKKPINPYGESKLAFEHDIEKAHSSWDLDATIFRFFNPFGSGELHDPETHAIPNIIRAAKANEDIELYWNGEQYRDFFAVEELAAMHVKALTRSGFGIFNLGSGEQSKVIDITKFIIESLSSTSKITDAGPRKGDPAVLQADITKAKKELDWDPTDTKIALKRFLTS